MISAAALAALATPAVAQKRPVFVEAASVADKPAVPFNKAKAYVLLRTDTPTPLTLMKIPSAEDQVAYDALRAEAFAEAREKYVKRQKSYESAMRSWNNSPKSTRGKAPDKPVEPTEANFEFTPFGLMTSVSMGPLFRFAKGDGGASTYLHQLTPGEYRVYGALSLLNGAMFGSCFCMGSVKFEARAGEITDLGVIMSTGAVVRPPAGDSSMPMLATASDFLGPAPADMALDPRLAQFPIRRAVYRPVGKLPNYYGVTIGRMPAMPGVFRYERDRIVDLTAGN